MGGKCRFVQPEIVRLPLSDGEWIDVKKELNAGEQRRVFSRLVKDLHFNERATLNPEQVGLSKVVEYIVDWSLCDPAGKHVPVSEAAICNLDGDTYQEIVRVVDVHENEIESARELSKNAKGTEINSSAT